MKYLPLAADNFLMELVLFLVEVEVLALLVVELKCENSASTYQVAES